MRLKQSEHNFLINKGNLIMNTISHSKYMLINSIKKILSKFIFYLIFNLIILSITLI